MFQTYRKTIASLAITVMTIGSSQAQESNKSVKASNKPLEVTTWNIEHLGSPGRGFGGGYGGYGRYATPYRKEQLPLRSPEQLKEIAQFINKDLKSDIIALQEVAITNQRRFRSFSKPLDKITAELNSSQKDAKWSYYLPFTEEVPDADDERNLHVGFLWNQKRVRLLKVFEMSMTDQILAGKELFKRKPIIGYFEEVREDGSPGIDFVLVNVHLASGQQNDENHLIAMTLIEFGITMDLAKNAVSEPSVIILGDFNENPKRVDKDGKQLTSPAMLQHMRFKGYQELVKPEVLFTRMNNKLDSLIDHVMANRSAQAHLLDSKVKVYKPGGGLTGKKELFAEWRNTYSDHFPLSFKIKSGKDNDPDFFE